MSDQITFTDAIQTIDAVVSRCGCGNPEKIHPGTPCPRPRKVTNLGAISYEYSGHPIRTMLVTAWIWIKRRFINDR
jgi:hypothetical protein